MWTRHGRGLEAAEISPAAVREATRERRSCRRVGGAPELSRNRDRRKAAAVMDGGAEPLQRREMFRHRIAHMALEAVARMGGADLHHQPVARDLGDDRGGRDRQHQGVARDHRLAVAGHLDAVAAVDIDELRPAGQGDDRLRQRPQRGLQDIVAINARGRAEGDADLGGRADAAIELLAFLAGQLLGIVEAARDAVRDRAPRLRPPPGRPAVRGRLRRSRRPARCRF